MKDILFGVLFSVKYFEQKTLQVNQKKKKKVDGPLGRENSEGLCYFSSFTL